MAKINSKNTRDRSSIGVLDYVLTAICSSLAVYSGGMSILKPMVGYFCVGMVLLGTALSFVIRLSTKNKKVLALDAIFYTCAAITSAFFVRDLQMFMPEGGFPPELITGSILCWILSLGSFFCWRDNTLLFQAIPSIALFGLVGCYDTFRNVTFAFFGFVLCLATLFARANSRTMLRLAIDSGYFASLDGTMDSQTWEDDGTYYQRIKDGPWRAVAGAEWALISALVIVLVSVLGAPVIQATVKPIAGQLAFATPSSIRNAATAANAGSMEAGDNVKVGRGPNNLRERPLFQANLDRLRYLRTATFTQYEFGGSWRVASATQDLAEASIASLALDSFKKSRSFRWEIRPIISIKSIPTPAEVYQSDSLSVAPQLDGTLSYQNGPQSTPITGISVEPIGATPKDAKKNLPANLSILTNAGGLPTSIRLLAERETKSGKNDFEKANLLMQFIGRTAKYNIKAEAAPRGSDAVENFLLTSKEGYCDLFASSMVLMARCINIPSRYVIGYLPNSEKSNGSHSYVVSETDYHAWAELFFEDVGWVVFDATSLAEEVEGAGRGSAGQKWYDSPWVKQLLYAVAFCVALVGVYFSYRVISPLFQPKPAHEQIRGSYSLFANSLSKRTKRRRKLSETPNEYLNEVAPLLGAMESPTRELNQKLERLLFGQTTPTFADAVKASAEVKAWKKLLRQTKSQ